MELSALAAEGMYDGKVPAAGIVTGIGRVNGVECMIVANDVRFPGFVYIALFLLRSLQEFELIPIIGLAHRLRSRADRITRSPSRSTSARRKSPRRTNSRASTSVSLSRRLSDLGQMGST